MSLKRYFKYIMFGHLAKVCTSGLERSDLCRRCEEKGHIIKVYNRVPKCLLCQGNQGQDNRHITGSNKYSEFAMRKGAYSNKPQTLQGQLVPGEDRFSRSYCQQLFTRTEALV